MLTQSLLGSDKPFQLGRFILAHFSLSLHSGFYSLALAFMALALTACATSSPGSAEPVVQLERSQTATEVATALLQTQETYYAALEDQSAQGMVDAATARNNLPFSALASLEAKAAIRATTISMLNQARSFTVDNQLLSDRIDRELDRLSTAKNSPRLLTGGLFGIKKPNQDESFVRTINLQGNATFTIELESGAAPGTIVYVEHQLNEKILLRLVNQQGIHLCSQQNPRGHLICRHKQKVAEKLTATVTNLGSMSTSVLFIRNQ